MEALERILNPVRQTMRRAAMIVIGICIAVAASGKPRPSERPRATTEAPPVHSNSRSQFTSKIATTFQDTIFFGGTTWAPDSMRWEALRDSVWTFDTGVGSSINTGQNPNKPIGYHETMEGWTGIYPYDIRGTFERSRTCAISGLYSLWAGVDSAVAAAHCWTFAGGQGYGDGWGVSRVKTFFYPGTGNITLSYNYSVQSQPGFDYAYVLIDTSGSGYDPITLASYTGSVSGTATVVLNRGTNLRSTPGVIRIQFRIESDGSYSDEDGLYTTTCGHTAIDNVRLTGAIVDFSDFESGDGGWVLDNQEQGWGEDFSNVAYIPNLPPMQVPGPCGVKDSVLVFHDQNQITRIYSDAVLASSPWIDLKRNGSVGRPGKLIRYDVYWQPDANSFFTPGQFVWIRVRWYPALCPATGGIYSTGFRDAGQFWCRTTPWCTSGQQQTLDVSNLIDNGAEQIQLAIGEFPGCGLHCGGVGSTPWLDNVRFGVYGVPTSSIPDVPELPTTALASAEPNPLRSTTRISFALSSESHVSLEVFDVVGRLVRTIVDSPQPGGPNTAIWDGRDDSGQRVPTGLYFYRFRAGDFSAARKLIVLR